MLDELRMPNRVKPAIVIAVDEAQNIETYAGGACDVFSSLHEGPKDLPPAPVSRWSLGNPTR